MIEQKQKVVDSKVGDCIRACIASCLELPNADQLPHIDKDTWYGDWNNLLGEFGMSLEGDAKKIWRTGYWIASVDSLNFKGVLHAIVMKDFKVAFDPSTKKRYRKGTSLLSKTVHYGFWFEICDVSKIHLLAQYRRTLLKQTKSI